MTFLVCSLPKFLAPIFTTSILMAGVSYCYPRKITDPIPSIPNKGFVNFHPALLPKYKGPTELDEAIKNNEM